MMRIALVFLVFANAAFASDLICGSSTGCLVIDTDPGGDDSMAISMVLGSPLAEKLVAITTVFGNTGVVNATRNAQFLLNFFNRSKEVDLAMGTDDAMEGPSKPTFYYGYDGFGDYLPPATSPPKPTTPKPSALYLADIVNKYPGKVTVAFIGPVTNLALAMHLNQKFLDQVKQIIILGGSYKGAGNTLPGVEANFGGDPVAASYIFKKSVVYNSKISLVPMETVMAAAFPMSYRKDKLGKVDSEIIKILNKAERISMKSDGKMWPAYDMSAIAVYLDSNIVTETLDAYIQVVSEGRVARGMVVTDFYKTLNMPPNVKIITAINQTMLSNMFFKFLS